MHTAGMQGLPRGPPASKQKAFAAKRGRLLKPAVAAFQMEEEDEC